MTTGNSIEVRGASELAVNLRLHAGLMQQSVYASMEQLAHATAAEVVKETEKIAPTRGQLEWELVGRITGGGGLKIRPSIKRKYVGKWAIAEARMRLAAIRSTAFGWIIGWFATKDGSGMAGAVSRRRGFCEKNLQGTHPWIRIGNKMAGAAVVEAKHGCLAKAIATVNAKTREIVRARLAEVSRHTGLTEGTAAQILGSK